MYNRNYDFYIKNFTSRLQQKLFILLQKIVPADVQAILEKDIGYPTFRRMGLKDEDIRGVIERYLEKFKMINELLIQNGVSPFFSDLSDEIKCCKEYIELLKERTTEEIIENFGCEWEHYNNYDNRTNKYDFIKGNKER